jgi:hypothetical protein
MLESTFKVKHRIIYSSVVDPHWFQGGSGSSFLPKCGSGSSFSPYFSELCKYFVDEIFEFSVNRLKLFSEARQIILLLDPGSEIRILNTAYVGTKASSDPITSGIFGSELRKSKYSILAFLFRTSYKRGIPNPESPTLAGTGVANPDPEVHQPRNPDPIPSVITNSTNLPNFNLQEQKGKRKSF